MAAFSIKISHRFIVGAAIVLGVCWWFYSATIAPLQSRQQAFLARRTELQEQIESTRKRLVAIKDAEQKLGPARTSLNRLIGSAGEDSLMVTFPGEIADHFARFGFPSVVVRLATARAEPDLPRYERIYWSVGVPLAKNQQSAVGLLLAVAELEGQNRFLRVIDFAIQPDAADLSQRMASINMTVLAPK